MGQREVEQVQEKGRLSHSQDEDMALVQELLQLLAWKLHTVPQGPQEFGLRDPERRLNVGTVEENAEGVDPQEGQWQC